jgi:NAD(P)-dependent dehydrogenase (short-subunit alcohol dehydrogenase family)
VFLNSSAAGYLTGQVLWVDGGNLASRIAATMEGSELWPV